ncbi:DUF58 domain-containing protein [Halorubellus sp. PRR65]|uniref:DUF58 domain-containing protein n=1 Tax=Halorubellus sp. PRR65 TaxID=3098148 RepID=UPI002B264036|nr:DUF58 domain-containing protein [Halorubellus sp. PRR65]
MTAGSLDARTGPPDDARTAEATAFETTRTGRYRGALAVAAVVAAVGALAGTPVLLLAAVVVAVVPAVGHAAASPEPAIVVDRNVRPADPAPGETVTVELRATNAGDVGLADVRVVDAPPDGVEVVDGSRALATALEPGGVATTAYEAVIPAGEHAFDDPFVAVHDATGSVAVAGRVAVEETTVAPTAPLPDGDAVTVAPPARGRPGRRPSDDAGDGLAFESVREYRRGDPAARVDWRRYARTGDLATVRYRERRAPTVVLVVDARERAHLAPDADAESAIRRGVDAARRVAGGADLAHVGVVALAPGYPTLDPGVGREHAHRVRAFLDGIPGVSTAPEPLAADGRALAAAVRARLPRGAQVCLCTPACDDAVADAATRLAAAGHAVGVCSPDPTSTEAAGDRLAALERRARLRALRRRGVAVVDWADEPLETALDRAGWTT